MARTLFTRKNRGFGGRDGGGSSFSTVERDRLYFRRRLGIAGFLVLAAFAGLFARFFYLQVVEHRHFQTLAETNRIAIVPIVPNRGVVTDRNGIVLAQSYSGYTIEITPSRVKNLDETIDALSEIVDVQPRDRKRFRKLLEESKNFESLPLRTRLSDEEVARFAVHRYRFPGVEIKARLFRQYPFGEIASHALGYIGRINDKDVERIAEWDEAANYKGSDYIGKVGVELSYERELHGTTGWEEVEVDANGRAVRTLSRTPANWQELNESIDKPLLNRPLRGAYPPGSTIKPFLAMSALNSGKRTPTQTISDPGFFQIPGQAHRFRDDKPGGHGSVDMYKSIVVSCDTYYYMLANETDIDVTASFMSRFGFGQKTGIDIEGELTGVLPSRDWKRQRFAGKNYRDEHRKWYLGDSISAGIGQGYNAFTPMQQAHAIAMIANDGVGYTPHLVKSVQNIKTGEVREIAAEPASKLNARPEHLAIIKNALVGVNKEGTSAAAFRGAKYVSGGKTGTAQVFSLKGEKYSEHKVDERLRDHAWFISYAPADKPKIAVAVLVENGGFGAQAAAPIARKVFDYYLLGEGGPEAAPVVQDRASDDESD